MQPIHTPRIHISLTLFLYVALLALLWLAGGASRGDALGQVLVRVGAWAIIIVALLFGPRPEIRTVRPVWFFIAAAVLVVIVQLIPIPLTLWMELRNHDIFSLEDKSNAWQSLTLKPGATLNSLSSLVVAIGAILLFAQANSKERCSLLSLLIIFTVSAVFIGLIQFSGVDLNSPLINDVPGIASSIFANRNHFALLVAMGCILAPVWAFNDREALKWRGPLAAALTLLFVLTVIAIGSRSGLLLMVFALIISTVLVGNRIRRRLRRAPRWLLPALALTALAIMFSFIALSFFAGRVEAIDRLFALAVEEDLRVRSRPVILQMIWNYMPFGAGLGSFDSVYRINEPTALLTLHYFNQAHNDYLGIALDAGLPGITLLAFAIAWWAHATIKVMRAADGEEIMLARLGSGLLLLLFVASATDYPVRTPVMMAITVIAGAWLAHGSHVRRRSALPRPAPDV